LTRGPSWWARRFAVIALAGAAVGSKTPPLTNDPPYEPSARIAAIEPDFSRLVLAALGSDNWAVTWAADDHQYAAWGDGGGFGGTAEDGRVSLGVARVEGDAADFRGVNVWGGKDAATPATFDGKSYGILSVEGTLYMWVSPGSGVDSYEEARLASSTDAGLTWQRADWAFERSTGLSMPTFLQAGRDYEAARDDFVYAYFVRQRVRGNSLVVQRPGAIDLGRAPRGRILDRGAWEFHAGRKRGETVWSADPRCRRAVFKDPNGVGWCVSAGFLPGPGRIVLCTEHTESFRGNVGMFESETPWGPWRTVLYEKLWGPPHVPAKSFFWNFAPRWSQGLDVVLVFTGIEELDAWASVPARIVLRTS
jgi:hypothetical protein